jgi:phage terminase small subunit
MGKNAKPVELHLAQGNPNRLTKKEIAERMDSEIKLGKKELARLKVPQDIKSDPAALAHWKKHVKEYKAAASNGIEILTTSDVDILAIYCKTYADYERLIRSKQKIDKISYERDRLDEYIEEAEEFNFRVKQQLRNLVSVDAILRIETAINKKMDMLIKMQDRLFLNPLAKVKNVLQPKKDEKPKSKFGRFGNGG